MEETLENVWSNFRNGETEAKKAEACTHNPVIASFGTGKAYKPRLSPDTI